jgi:hypothetical protein
LKQARLIGFRRRVFCEEAIDSDQRDQEQHRFFGHEPKHSGECRDNYPLVPIQRSEAARTIELPHGDEIEQIDHAAEMRDGGAGL